MPQSTASFSPPPPDVLRVLLHVLGLEPWATLIWDMHHTAKGGLSFSVFQDILGLLGIRTGMYQVDYDMLLDIKPLPCLLYSDSLHEFALLKSIEADGMTFYDKNGETVFLTRAVMEQSWDGKILAMGKIPDPISIPTATCVMENVAPNPAPTLLLEATTEQGCRQVIGKLAPGSFDAHRAASFECLLPGPFDEIELLFSALSAEKAATLPLLRIHVPLVFQGRKGILRFFFAGTSDAFGPAFLGIKGSVQGLFRIASPQNENR